MIRYPIYLPLQLICMVLCYLTNWLVVLFADEQGELPGLLRMWQTWDDTLDNKTDVGRMPSCLRYDWDAHYIQEHRMECGQIRYTERLIKPFGLADRIRRYCCRVHWLYRNCAYGFAFYLFGATVWPQQYPIQTKSGDGWYFCRSDLVWAYKNEARITGRWYWKIYLGWKLQRTMQTDYQAMIATRLWISRK